MMALARRKRRRPDMRRAVILFPSGLTLGNLFFGVFAIIAASRLEFVAAGVYVLLGGICDALDGRVARATNAGTEFGEELDSLVDAITFGLAPGMIMYFAVLNRSGWDWVWVFLFAACAVLRLARFNIEQAGTAKTYFQGLPSPAAGITLASYYWFSQSSLYTYGAIADLKWHVLLRYLMVVLSFLMISNVPYPVFPRTGFRSLRAIGATVLLIGSMILLATRRLEYFFPFALIYVAWGLVRWVFSGLFERRQPTLPYDLSEGEDDEDEEDDEFELDSQVHATRWSHRAHRAAGTDLGEQPERESRAERTETGRSRLDRIAARKVTAEHPAERGGRTERAERTERTERAERGGRTRDAERPKREGRQKERGRRSERSAREPRTEATEPTSPAAAVIPAAAGVDAITLGRPDQGTAAVPTLDDTARDADVADAEDNVIPVEGAVAPRKRKRRRRRGDRKDRDGSERREGADDSSSDSSADFSSPEATTSSSSPMSSSSEQSVAAPTPAPEPTPLLPRPSSESTE
ncbi:MAG TPA: CDP-diacylglycerol--serine O-phosphatidyltransferase [Gemmatimonadaceae bacterium]